MLVPEINWNSLADRLGPRGLRLFLLGSLPAMIFAVFTRHQWEDWFITLRAAQNLASGHGLVYEPGQVLQTFTSPINVLLPAALMWLSGNNEVVTIWLYRIIGACLLGCTVLLLDRLARKQGLSRLAGWFLIGFFVIDVKIMDFTINGQEAAFTVFSLSLTLLAMMERRTWLLGAAWACTMWSRPDGFIYIGGLAIGYFLALWWERRRHELWPTLVEFFKAGCLTTLLYGPWIAWTTWYYGTPISHTIAAKGEFLGDLGVWKLVRGVLLSPVDAYRRAVLGSIFTPPYVVLGGWPEWLTAFSAILGAIAFLAWLAPRASTLVRVASLGLFVTTLYLTLFAPFPYPWYFPPCAFLAIVTLAAIVHQLVAAFATQPLWRRLVNGLCGATLIVWFVATVCTAWELRVQERVIERNGREQIGLWLKQQADGQRQTVFLECLGYIGYYSGLKMYDYPGMSSPEVVAARKQQGDEWPHQRYTEKWAAIIGELKPDWLVMRPPEVGAVTAHDPSLLESQYRAVKVFDQADALNAIRFLPGRGYLNHDSKFTVYRRIDMADKAAPSQSGNPGR